MLGLVLLLCAAAAELRFARALLDDQAALALALHLTAAVLVAGAVAAGFSLARSRLPRSAVLAASLLVIFVPVVGLIGLLCAILPTWRAKPSQPNAKCFEVALPRFADSTRPGTPTNVAPPRGSLSDAAVEQRFEALRTLRRMPPERATRLIRQALSDSSEDVRLLAFALLDQGERAIRQRLDRHMQQLQVVQAERDGADALEPNAYRAAALQLAIAQAYFDLVHGEFLLGSTAREALERAAECARAVQTLQLRGRAAVLLARIYLRLRRTQEADGALITAAAAGVAPAVLAPLRAESYFLQRRFDAVTDALAHLSPVSARRAVLRPVVEYWRGKAAR